MVPSIDPVTAAVTCEDCGVAQPYHPVLTIEWSDCGAKPGRKCKRPSGHRIRQSHAAHINAAYVAGYTKCPCKTDNAVICAGSTVSADVRFDPDAVTIEETDSEESLDPDAFPTLPCSLGAEGLPPVGASTPSRRSSTKPSADHPTDILSLQ